MKDVFNKKYMTIENLMERLKANWEMAICAKFQNKIYILVSWNKDGKFVYGFKPYNKLWQYEYGYGTTEYYNDFDEFNRLERYLREFLDNKDGEIVAYDDLQAILNHWESVPYHIYAKPNIEIQIKINGKISNEPLDYQTAKQLGIVK